MSIGIKVISAMLTLTLVGAGCASAAAGGGPGSATRSPTYISARELQDPSVSDGSVLEAIRRLRPNFLDRGSAGYGGTMPEIEVSYDNSAPVSLSTLEDRRVSEVESVTLLKDADALQRFGMREKIGPVLLIILKKK